MKSVSLAILLTLAVAAPAFAADPPKPATATAPTAGADKAKPVAKPEDKLICHREEDTGSFIPRRVCKTQAQIDQDRRNAQQMKDDHDALGGRADR